MLHLSWVGFLLVMQEQEALLVGTNYISSNPHCSCPHWFADQQYVYVGAGLCKNNNQSHCHLHIEATAADDTTEFSIADCTSSCDNLTACIGYTFSMKETKPFSCHLYLDACDPTPHLTEWTLQTFDGPWQSPLQCTELQQCNGTGIKCSTYVAEGMCEAHAYLLQ